MTVKFLHLVVVICISTSTVLVAATKETPAADNQTATETKAVPAKTQTAPAEAKPAATETKPAATETKPAATETKPVSAKDTHADKKTEAEAETEEDEEDYDEEEEAAMDETEGLSPFRYVAGGALSIFPGFGLGHAVQGRLLNDYGWAFTLGQVVTFIGINLYDDPYCSSSWSYSEHSNYNNNACEREAALKRKIQPYWVAAFLLFKFGEIVHAWWPSKHAPLQQRRTNPDAAVIPRHRYLWGGALGTTVGFGLGHAVQGRWWSQGRGWVHTLTQLPIVPAIYSLAVQNSCEDRARTKERERRHEGESWGCPNPIGNETAVLLIGMYVVSRVIEVFSVWDINYNQHRVAGTGKRDSLLLLPYADNRGFGLQLAFSH